MALNEEESGSFSRIPKCEDVNCCYCSDLAREKSVASENSSKNASSENKNISVEYKYEERNPVNSDVGDTVEISMDVEPPSELSSPERKSREDTYDDLNNRINKMIANKHGHDYIWESYIRRLKQINDSKNTESSRIACWDMGDHWILTMEELEGDITSFQSQLVTKSETSTSETQNTHLVDNESAELTEKSKSKVDVTGEDGIANNTLVVETMTDSTVRAEEIIVDESGEQNCSKISDLSDMSMFYSSVTQDRVIEHETSSVEKKSDDVYSQTIKDLRKMQFDVLKVSDVSREITGQSQNEFSQSTPDTRYTKSDKADQTDVSITTYLSEKEEHNIEECEICKKFGESVKSEREELVESNDRDDVFEKQISRTSTREENITYGLNVDVDNKTVMKFDNDSEKSWESVDYQITQAEDKRETEMEERLNQAPETDQILTYEDQVYISNIVNDHSKTYTEKSVSDNVKENSRSEEETGKLRERETEGPEVNKATDVSNGDRKMQEYRSRTSDSMKRQISYLHEMDWHKLENEWNTTMDGLRSQISGAVGENSSEKVEEETQVGQNEKQVNEDASEGETTDNCEEILDRLKREIRKAVGLDVNKSEKDKKSVTQRRTSSQGTEHARKARENKLSTTNASIDIDLASPRVENSPGMSRKESESDSRPTKTMFQTVIDRDLDGDDWETTIEDLRIECHKIAPNAPKLPGRDPRDKLRALMKIAEARWRYMTWLMAEANPEDNGKYKTKKKL